MKRCPNCGGNGKQRMTGAITGWANVPCEACGGSGTVAGMDIAAEFQTEGYPRGGYKTVSLSFRSFDTSLRVNLSLKETQRLRDRLETLLQKFWAEEGNP